jgi:hypothetical protein
MSKPIVKRNLRVLLLGLFAFFLFAGILNAGERHRDDSLLLKQKDIILTHQILENILEDQAYISGLTYLITSKTHFTLEDQHGKHRRTIKNQDIGAIAVPCLVDITYRTYSVYTEGTPFHGDRELLSVNIIHAISKRKVQYRRSLRK